MIEEARRRDAPTLLQLQRRVLTEGQWFVITIDEFTASVEDIAKEIRDHRRSPNSVYLVARRERPIIGFVTVSGGALVRQRHAAKLQIMVDAAHRGQGVGQALVKAAITWATDNEMITKIGLNVFTTNHSAIGVYHRLGFTEEGRRPGEYRMEDGTLRDELLLQRPVPSVPVDG